MSKRSSVTSISSISFVGMAVLLCANLSGCRNNTAKNDKYPIKIVATTGMVADLVSNVGGKHVKVTQLLGAGTDPHIYEPKTTDIATLKAAHLIFYSGLHLEGNLTGILKKVGKKIPTHSVADSLKKELLLHDPENPKSHDPHVWFDVSIWMECAKVVRDKLIEYDDKKEHHADYRKSTEAYLKELKDLDGYAMEQIATIPAKQQVLVTAHDAFQYFGKRYKITVKAIQGISTENEAGLKKISELVKYVSDKKIKAVFTETTVPSRAMKSIIDACKAKGHTVTLVGESDDDDSNRLYSDAMGEPGSGGDTYIKMIRHNVDTIVRWLKK